MPKPGTPVPHLGFAILALVAAPLTFAFVWQHGVATLMDDSLSYLTLARHFAPGTEPWVEPWVAWRSHFSPLFPLALAWTGGSRDFLVAHLVVAAFALAALYPLYRLAALELGGTAAGLAVVLVFLLAPNAWISIKGILSEPMFLWISLGALYYHATRLQQPGAPATRWLLFGVLLACAYLTRAAGVALILAWLAHVAVRIVRGRERPAWPLLAPLVPVVLLLAAWMLLRPTAGYDTYRRTGGDMLAAWLAQPRETLAVAAREFVNGWVAVFTADARVSIGVKVILAAFGVLGIAGAVRRALANRLDGWYVLIAVAITFAWVVEDDNTRRLLYPLVPLIAMHALDAVLAACRRLGLERRALAAALGVAAVPVALSLPALVLVAQKAFDRAPIAVHSGQSLADNLHYYTRIDVAEARFVAAKDIAVLDGLTALRTATPPGARVMWMRPEYVAILGERPAVPLYYRWDPAQLAREIRDARVDYVVASTLYKTDLDVTEGNPLKVMKDVPAYSHEAMNVRSAVSGEVEFVLMKVDREALAAYLARAGGR